MAVITYVLDVPDALLARIIVAMRALYPEYAAMDNITAFRATGSQFWRTQVLGRYEGSQAGLAAQTAFSNAYENAYNQAVADFDAIG